MAARALRTLIYALAYAGLGWLALHIAPPPGFASPLFPSAGVALAVVLIDGRRGLLAVLLGAAALHFLYMDLAGPGWGLALTITCGAVLQAWAGAWLLKRDARWPAPPDDTRPVLRWVAVAALSAAINASIVVPVMGLVGLLPLADLPYSWWNWWTGDAVGVLVMTPLLLALDPASPQPWRRDRLGMAVPLVVAGGGLVLFLTFFSRWEEERVGARFNRDASEVTENLRERVTTALSALEATALFFENSEDVSREEFLRFTQPWLTRSPDILAFGSVAPVASDELGAFEALEQTKGFAEFHVRERLASGELVAPASGGPYHIISMIAPETLNRPALGVNVASVPVAWAALSRTLRDGGATATAAFRLSQQKRGELGIVVYRRLQGTEQSATPGGSHAVFISLQLARLMAVGEGLLALCVTDVGERPVQALHRPATCADGPSTTRYRYKEMLDIAGRSWELALVPTPAYLGAVRGLSLWLMPGFALLASALLTAFLLSARGRTRRVEELVALRTAEFQASERRLADILENTRLAAVLLDTEGVVRYANPFVCALLGQTRESLVGRDWFDTAMPASEQQPQRTLFTAAMHGDPFDATRENLIVDATGGRHLFAWHRTVLRDEQGRIAGLASIGEDVSARRRAEAEREAAAATLAAAIAQSPSGIVVVEAADLRVRMANRRVLDMVRNPGAAEQGSPVLSELMEGWTLLNPDGSACALEDAPLVRAVSRGEVTEARELIARDANGRETWLSVNAAPVRSREGEIIAGILVFNDITELKDQQLRLQRLAHYDPLTRLPNRALLADRLEQAIARSRRSGEEFAVAYLDLDGFKEVNDRLGHDAGDVLLVEIAERLRSVLRGEDTVARLGGDEFVLLLSNAGPPGEWRVAVERMLARIVEPVSLEGEAITVSASVGVTLFPDDDAPPEVLLRHADQAMYLAKQAGRNRFHRFDPEHDRRARDWQAQHARLEQALNDGELDLLYQPRVDLVSGRIESVEALVRWRHPQRGMVSPAEFLPIAEGTTLINSIGKWVIRAAVRQAAQWARAGIEISVGVNIAPEQLQDEGFMPELEAVLAQYPELPPGRIEFEIVESAALADIQLASRIINSCAELGVRFALDDFGTGYSSLAYFRRLPAQVLKIDQSFIRDMLHDPEDLAIVEGVIGLARVFQRTVVAEGVETALHGALLLSLGCERAQGYGIARPMPAGALPGWIAAWRPDPIWSRDLRRVDPEDIPLLAAEVEHQNWVDRLSAEIASSETSQPLSLLDARSCRLGVWLGSPRAQHYAAHPALAEVRRLHEAMHRLAARIAADRAAGEPLSDLVIELEALRHQLFIKVQRLWLD
ncbi:EAL domain-containing protein [Niveibacterium sp. SC-1]|uniref:EAL domain-containing protein n=1 Tax=Niveibacterium sp. SC-1 TaxID=3135646 RepID=UPI00311F346F